jgi:PPM family protein phosphatase
VSERRNIILQALGPEAAIKVDITHQQLRRGDVLVLCSDGLSGLVRDHEIGRVARESHDLVTLCNQLIYLANESGGPDNITVVAARFDGDGLEAPSVGDEVGHQPFAVGENTPVTPHPKLEPATAPLAAQDELTDVLNAAPAAADPAAYPSLQPNGVRRALTPADIEAAKAALDAAGAGPRPKGRKRRAAVLIVAVAAIAVLVLGLVAYLRAK